MTFPRPHLSCSLFSSCLRLRLGNYSKACFTAASYYQPQYICYKHNHRLKYQGSYLPSRTGTCTGMSCVHDMPSNSGRLLEVGTVAMKGSSKVLGISQTTECRSNSNCSLIARTLYDDLPKTENIDSFMQDVHVGIQAGEITVDNIVNYLEELQQLTYGNLSSLPWLHSHNVSLSYMQLLMNDVLEKLMSPVLQHQHWEPLLRLLQDYSISMDKDHAISSLLICLYLGVDKTHPVITSLLFRVHDCVQELGFSALADLSDALRCFRRSDLQLVGKAIHRFVELIEEIDVEDFSESDFLLFSHFAINVWNLISQRMMSRILGIAVSWIKQMKDVSEPLVLSSYCRLVNRTQQLCQWEKQRVKDSLDKLTVLIENGAGELQPHHIAEMSHNLKTAGFFTPELSAILQKRSTDIMQSDDFSRISEITNTCYSFTRSMPLSVKRQVEDVIYRHLQDADVLILSNLADVLVDIGCQNNDIIELYEYVVLQHLPNILQFVTRLTKVLRLFNTRQSKNSHHKEQLYDAVLRQLKSQQGFHVWSIANLSNFLLRHVRYTIPDILQEKLIAIIPQCGLPELNQIITGMSRIRRPRLRVLHNQILQLQTHLHANIAQQVDKVASLDVLHQMVVTLYIKGEQKDNALLGALMAQYPKFTKNLNQAGFIKTLTNFNQLLYYSSEILEDLISYAMENHEELGIDRFCYFVHTLGQVGYVPQQTEQFSQVCVKMFELAEDYISVQTKLKYAWDLSKLQIYPETLLNTIFTVEFIEDIDKYIDGQQDIRQQVEKMFMKLNRCIVLECPQLDVPWFHEQYCQENVLPVDSEDRKPSRLQLEVQSVLREITGGDNYYKKVAFSPYYYLIDFECLLNAKGVPVPYVLPETDQAQEAGLQRVAIQTLQESSYCVNKDRLNGYEQMKRRHLEILGYKLVQVPTFEWYSMALTEYPAKVSYLHEKIFK